jgi:hypothetical protein
MKKQENDIKIKRNCPNCNKVLFYKTIGNLNWANKHNKKCRTCSFKDKVGLYERNGYIRQRIGDGNRGKPKNWVDNELRKQRSSKSLTKGRQSKEEKYLKQKEWNNKNKPRVNSESKNKYKTNQDYKLKKLLKSRFYKLIKGKQKNGSFIKYLGCSIEELKSHLEQQFKPEMTWENHGTIWEIDHIIPISSFDMSKEENIFKCWNYNNLQPLFLTTKIAESFGYLNEIGNKNKSNKL